jgi:hypothetical protein
VSSLQVSPLGLVLLLGFGNYPDQLPDDLYHLFHLRDLYLFVHSRKYHGWRNSGKVVDLLDNLVDYNV